MRCLIEQRRKNKKMTSQIANMEFNQTNEIK